MFVSVSFALSNIQFNFTHVCIYTRQLITFDSPVNSVFYRCRMEFCYMKYYTQMLMEFHFITYIDDDFGSFSYINFHFICKWRDFVGLDFVFRLAPVGFGICFFLLRRNVHSHSGRWKSKTLCGSFLVSLFLSLSHQTDNTHLIKFY